MLSQCSSVFSGTETNMITPIRLPDQFRALSSAYEERCQLERIQQETSSRKPDGGVPSPRLWNRREYLRVRFLRAPAPNACPSTITSANSIHALVTRRLSR